ncbi:hypothetical protein [Serratia aquatilis]|uniref:MaoC-like domain-containing protein n=1 Tax=Serratia aquatilis TaxID=1737515 RepID=A0ABV6EBA1_9GAMM
MDYTYTLRDAEAWAAFSGDYNPIHFDLQHVRKMGAEKLSVHGMRAMLDMKRQLSAALLAGEPQQDFYVFSTRLRQPVLCQTPYHLQIAGNGERVTGKLLDSTTQESCFSSKLTSAEPLVLSPGEREYVLTADEVFTQGQQFPGDVSDITQTWGFLDALLFQRLVKSPDMLAMLTSALPELAATTLIEVFSQIPVVQTHHETHFSARLFAADSYFQAAERLYYAILPMLIMGNSHSGFVLRAVVQARLQHQPLMTTAVTLKTWPVAVN